ncbi:beta strand repeat-containing protein [Niveispirillum sp. KHB5.9]|uniref:beta strand repeat-containing protein n=1 Tax=Niveispirillum sp. KHB5.9 TaxID=3400269 RepID=UPI003A87C6DD
MASPSIVVFNEAYYLAQNPDVAAAVAAGAYQNGLAHWQAYGQSEGRLSSAFFDLQTYKDNNPDLNEEAGFTTDADYVRHFTTYGHNEPRVFLSAAVFNADIYAAQNPDLAAAGITDRQALEAHFLRSGVYEGRIAKADFDPVAYINANADLKALLDAGGNINGYTSANIAKAGWFHYYNFGISEGRTVPVATPTVTAFAAGGATVTEGNAATFTVTLSIPLSHDVTYTFNVTGDTKGGALNAASATDFGSVTGTVTIPAGSTSATFTVTPTADGVSEGLEGFKVTLFDGSLNVVKTSDVVGIVDAAAPVTPKTITLSTGADAGTGFVGDTANDTFIGAFNLTTGGTDTTTTTLTAGDSLVGGAGTDTLSLSVAGSGTGTGTVTPTLVGIEHITIASSLNGTGTATFDLALTDSSLSNLSVTSSVNAGSNVAFTNVSKIVAVDAKGVGNLSVGFASGVVSGTGDALSLTLGGFGTGVNGGTNSGTSFDVNGIETLNIASNGAANAVRLGTGAIAGTTTVNASGSTALTLDLVAGAVRTVNASGLASGLTLLNATAGNVTVTGGAGNDSFDFGTGFDATIQNSGTGSQLDVVAGGSGTDTLKIQIDNNVVADAVFGNVTSVEALTIDMSSAGSTGTITLDSKAAAAGIVTVNETGSGNIDLTLGTGYTGTLTVNLRADSNTDSAISVTASGSANLVVNAAVSTVNTGLEITGSTGTGTTDTLVLTAASGASSGVFGAGVTSLDKITILAATGATSAILTTAEATVASGKTLVIDASALGTGTAFTLSGAAETDGGKFSVTGGAGNDYLIVGSAADTVFGGAGNDTIDASAGGNDVLSGGAGNDTFILSGALTSGDVIDGGDGVDTLVLSSGTVTSAMLTGVTNVENLVFSGDATLSAPIQFSSFDLSLASTAGTLTLASGYTGATTVTLGSGDSVVNTGANVALSVHVTDVAYGSGTGQLIYGGTGTDTLYLTGGATGASGGSPTIVTLHSGSNVEVINIVDAGDGTGTGSTGAGKDVSLVLATGYTKSVTVDASSLDSGSSGLDETFKFDASASSGTVTVTGGAANDSITGSAGNDVLIGGAGADSLTAGSGFDNVSGGDGNDTLVFSTFFDGNDTVAGGSGTDTLSVEQGTGGIGDLAFLNVTSIETLSLGSGTGAVVLDTRAQAAGIVTVALSASANNVVNAGGYSSGIAFVVNATTGDVALTGGAGNDSFTFSGASSLNSSDSLIGGSGTDTIILTNGTNSGTGIAFSGTLGNGVSGIEQITISDTATGTGSTGSFTLTLASGFNSGAAISIDASALGGTGETLTLTGASGYNGAISATGGAAADLLVSSGTGADRLFGGAGNDSIDAGAGNDVVDGGAGDDLLYGNAGADTITGGAGNDVFAITSGSSTSTGADTITDFSSGDVVRLYLSGSGAISIDNSYKGSASSYANALSLLTGQSGTNAGQYVYVSDLNQLVIDVDGNGLLQGNDLYITLSGTTGIATNTVALDYTVNTGSGTFIGGAASDRVSQSGVGALTLSGIEAYSGDSATGTVTLSGTTAITITDTNGLNVTGAAGVDTITVSSAATGHVYDLASGADVLTFSGVVASATVTGGAGNDVVTFAASGANTATLNSVETVNGSSGADVFTLGTSGDSITVVDAGGGVTFNGNTGNFAATITIGTGNASTVTVVSSATATGAITVNGTTGADTVHFTSTASGSGVLSLGSGNDAVTLSGTTGTTTITDTDGTADTLTFVGSGLTAVISGIESVTGGGGVDTVTLSNTGSDTILLGAATGTGVTFSSWGTGADVINLTTTGGADTIVFGTGFSASGITGLVFNNFDAGASSDVLDFSAIVAGTTIATTGAAYDLGATTAADLVVGTNGVVLTYGSLTLSNTDFTVTASQSNTDIYVGNNDPFIVFATASTSSTAVNVYLVDRDLDSNAADVSANDIRLIGTINLVTGDSINTFANGNFIL